MSKDAPEWLRVKQETQAMLASLWNEIERLTDWIWQIEKRIDKLDKQPPSFIPPDWRNDDDFND